jgi:hypothetical protein
MVIVSIFPATVPSTFLKIKTLSDDGYVISLSNISIKSNLNKIQGSN